eukprot:TRINITY_DN58345_c0_g2_i1.p1 TRINITY_DN58345_c0_g2~~TRINITY_DN58345_c0_g2_i1.p1  ORF type:complete len:748 (-),score=61.40 TRINITY_DN58345_c0_g2_i1:94-2337(-)
MLRLLCLLVLFVSAHGTKPVDIKFSDNGMFDVLIGGQTWFTSGATSIRDGGRSWSNVNNSLIVSTVTTLNGEDALGAYHSTITEWVVKKDGPTMFVTAVRQYDSAVVFEQFFPQALTNTSVAGVDAKDNVITSFPALRPGNTNDLGVIPYGGFMVSIPEVSGPYNNQTKKIAHGQEDSGPIFFVNKARSHTVVVSPFSNFFAASRTYSQPELNFGVWGTATSIPAEYSMSFILSVTEGGVNEAALEWGDRLLTFYNKPRSPREHDYTLQNIGYSTDNGAFYYYHTQKNKTYEQTLLDVKKYADSLKLPYKYILLDSWWYFKGPHGGVTQWTAMPSIFPHNLTWFYNHTGWRIQGHNRYWSPKTPYAKQNGGPWEFIIEGDRMALPVQQDFWTWLLGASKEWGLAVYEQDWLSAQTPDTKHIIQSATLGRQWLLQMGRGAREAGLSIQYCMSWGRHILQSVEIPAVTQARASQDYAQGRSDQWQIGESSLFSWAVAIAPTKDNYWSITHEPGNRWHTTEPFPALQSAVSSLSHGPVAPSDGIGDSNATLIMRACMADGRLLSPERPAIAVDEQMYGHVWKNGVTGGQLWTTYSKVDGHQWFHVFAAELPGEVVVTPSTFKAPSFPSSGEWVVYPNQFPQHTPQPFSSTNPLKLPKCDKTDFQFYHIAPLWTTKKIALLGESHKWIRVSSQRFRTINQWPDDTLSIEINGMAGEMVFVDFWVDQKVQQVNCTINESGMSTIMVPAMACK